MENTAADLAVREIMFDGDPISILEKDREYFVAMKPICEVLGLDWDNQRKAIKADPVLGSTTVETTLVAEDGKQRDMVCLPLSYLNGWLFKIDAGRYEGERQEKIIRYQKECYEVLFSRFFKHLAKSSPSQWPDYLQTADHELKMVGVIHKQQDAAAKAAERILTKQARMEDYECVPLTKKIIEKTLEGMKTEQTEESMIAAEMAKDGASMTAICKRLWGSSGGNQLKKLRTMLAMQGISRPGKA